MTIEKARKHPAFQAAYNYAYSIGLRGGMEEMEFSLVVIGYLHGYNKAKKEKK